MYFLKKISISKNKQVCICIFLIKKENVSAQVYLDECIWTSVSAHVYLLECISTSVSVQMFLYKRIGTNVSAQVYLQECICKSVSVRVYLQECICTSISSTLIKYGSKQCISYRKSASKHKHMLISYRK